jgi:vacuolar protein sorting-associated protein 29
MPLVLLVGDLHIPYRTADVPELFKTMFVPGKIQTVLCTGNVTSAETVQFFKSFCSDVHCVAGDQDDYSEEIPEFEVLEIGELKFGLIHGHQVVPWGDKEALGMWQRRLDVDVLVSGHTHSQKHYELDGKLYVNPGSLTGAFSSFECDVTPTFVLMDVRGTSVTSFIYSTDGAELKVKKRMFSKS